VGLAFAHGAVEIQCRITNDAGRDVWICDTVNGELLRDEVYLTEDRRTLVIRRRHDVPTEGTFFAPPLAKYTRMKPGESRAESFAFSLPVRYRHVFMSAGRLESGSACARRLVLEIGYFAEDLPGMIRAVLSEADKFSREQTFSDTPIVRRYFGGLLVFAYVGGVQGFTGMNPDPETSGEVWVPYTFQSLKGEQLARMTVDPVSIPYEHAPYIITTDDPSEHAGN
jgi:hypothetical protein